MKTAGRIRCPVIPLVRNRDMRGSLRMRYFRNIRAKSLWLTDSKVLNTDRIHFETVHGVRINPYLFAGLGLGFDYFYGLLNDYDGYYEEEDTMGVLPVFVDFKGYCPVSPKASIYLAWDLGAAVGVSGLAQGTEFYTSIGPGIDFGGSKGGPRGNFGIRFQHMGEGLNAVLFRVGCSF